MLERHLLSRFEKNVHFQSITPLDRFGLSNLKIERSDSCHLMSQKFHTQIRNGRDRRAPLIGRYCNSYSLVPIVSKDSSLYIKFKSDYHLAGRGFSARYETRKIAFTFKIIDLIVIKLNKFESRVQDDTTEGSSLEFK